MLGLVLKMSTSEVLTQRLESLSLRIRHPLTEPLEYPLPAHRVSNGLMLSEISALERMTSISPNTPQNTHPLMLKSVSSS